ncbi:hypothetical protein H0H81_008149 [Sphagnurus paluster]|uniref:CAP-Gly domain-containing protein n=1 Tax=Sphagnurus paluster TaxID=117069 RepID=A0A9P7FST9_9AGAR|nr:hypothetical protein H0H81_008149 [Sphagnurus paluster]
MDLPLLGSRIRLAGHLGTISYIGNVDNTSGTWLGIEWDDPLRGKHDGCKDGKRYFTCRVPNSGSFIRPSANLCYGQSFLEALSSKYIEIPHGSGSQESVVLGSSHGAIVVQAVHLDKIRGKLADLGRLREVSLDNEGIARCDRPGMIRETCPIMETAFLNLTELQLNGTKMTWPEMQTVTAAMPKLRLVEMGHNSLVQLQTEDSSPTSNNTIQVINLDSNNCSDWTHIWKSLSYYKWYVLFVRHCRGALLITATSLQRLILTSNCVGAIPLPEHPQEDTVKHISLSHNKIDAWSNVDALSSWCPGLETLTLSGNPLMSWCFQCHHLIR